MQHLLIGVILVTIVSYAKTINIVPTVGFTELQGKIFYPDSLVATVQGIADNDTLFVRQKADYHSKKLGALPEDAFVGVDECKQMGVSTWCKIHHIALRDYEMYASEAPDGWVNAKYLHFNNTGAYVLIDGKGNCDYVLGCYQGNCNLVDDYDTNKNYEITSIQTKKIDRSRLRGSNHFGAMTKDGDGYCTIGGQIEDYLQKKRYSELLKQDADPLHEDVLAFTKKLRNIYTLDEILPYIHPKKGVVMTWNELFGASVDMRFGYADIENIEKNSEQKIHWGQSDGKGDDVFLSLYDYIKMLTRPLKDISRIENLKNLKGFKCSSVDKCRGYEVFWIDENSDTKEYDWLGLVVIFQEYKHKWYVVGLLRDRWTI
jgi:hypothetical protein